MTITTKAPKFMRKQKQIVVDGSSLSQRFPSEEGGFLSPIFHPIASHCNRRMTFSIKPPKFMRKQKQASMDDNAAVSEGLPSEEGRFLSPIPRPIIESHFINSRDSTECSTIQVANWKSCERQGYHKHSPLIAQTVLYAHQARGIKVQPSSFTEEMRNLDIAMERAAQLPRNSWFCNNHIMVNRVREKKMVTPLNRNPNLDMLARWHAEAMAAAGAGAFHADPVELQTKLNKPSRRIGSNVAVGESIECIHKQMIQRQGDYNNIIDRRYTEMGMGTSRGCNGKLYLCQIFRG